MLAVHSRSLKSTPRLKLIGAGNAGCNMLDRFVLRTGSNTNSAAVNTDAAHLNACVAAEKPAAERPAWRRFPPAGQSPAHPPETIPVRTRRPPVSAAAEVFPHAVPLAENPLQPEPEDEGSRVLQAA